MEGKAPARFVIKRAFERIDPLKPMRHLVEDGKPLCPEGAALLQRKNRKPVEAPAPFQFTDWSKRKADELLPPAQPRVLVAQVGGKNECTKR